MESKIRHAPQAENIWLVHDVNHDAVASRGQLHDVGHELLVPDEPLRCVGHRCVVKGEVVVDQDVEAVGREVADHEQEARVRGRVGQVCIAHPRRAQRVPGAGLYSHGI